MLQIVAKRSFCLWRMNDAQYAHRLGALVRVAMIEHILDSSDRGVSNLGEGFGRREKVQPRF